MAQELAPKTIRVNSIAPGAIKTAINRAAWETKEALENLLKLIPDGRIGEPEDIAAPPSGWLRINRITSRARPSLSMAG